MNATEAKCPSCHGPLGPWSLAINGTSEAACSQACLDAITAGTGGSSAKPTDYSTIALEVDVLRKALMRQR